MNKIITIAVLAVFSFLVLYSCSDDDSPTSSGGTSTTQGSIGPEGGTISIAGKVTFTIPAGALADTVDFSIATNASPDTLPGPLGPASTCYTIDPSGTVFSTPATIIINYDPTTVADAGEHTVGLYTNEGAGWVLLTTVRDTVNNTVAGPVSHLSDFIIAGDTTRIDDAIGVFAELIAGRMLYTGPISIMMDNYSARLDSAYAPCDPVQPIGGATITCEGNTLVWSPEIEMYYYSGMSMISPGAIYTFNIAAGNGVPALEDSIAFPTSQPQLASPTAGQLISPTSNVNVTWTGSSGGGMIDIIILNDAGDSVFYIQTENDGAYLIENDQMTAPIGDCSMMLSYYNRKTITATGYDPRSFIAGRFMHSIDIYFVDDSK
ncbi:MAG: hypothetical protein R3F48_17810 [Candidatus Zixiibacteriota bacterium]